ncbi:DoxX family protein [Leptospira fluminis]|uniref:DoxX family protein n=1 Tax=Leptospira fluminis TaxID=2484979 RepID=A0A4R9GR10_9LEPT|nr:DoxX family protein [Leptospira fluminis]TGK18732.1 DoxX family protein [Leptospira fluminis]
MKKNKIIFWTSTIIVSLMMVFSAFNGLTNPLAFEGFQHLGFPGYFRVELSIAKILGVAAILIPQVPDRVKEWAYAGFGITFISAGISHYFSGDEIGKVIMPYVMLGILAASYIFRNKIAAEKA